MRVRPLVLIGAVFGAAALAAAFVVAQFPREGDVSPPAPLATSTSPSTAVSPPPSSPALERADTATEGTLEVRVTAGGEPQGGADVRLYLGVGEGAWRRAAEGRTGRDGLARLFARPGAYVVAVRAAGLAPARVEAVRTAGEEVSRVEVGLEPPAALAGRVTARAGGAVSRAKVRVLPVVARWPGFAPPSAPPEETLDAEADAAGAFRVEGLAPGTYAVAVEAPGFHPVLLPRASVPGDALAVALEPLGTVAGVALLSGGRPAAGAAIRAASADHGAAAIAGADGRFVLAAPAGRYHVHAALGDRAGAMPLPVVVAAGAVAGGLEVRLEAAATLEGEVELAASGRPLAGAEVAVSPHETREVVARARTDASGRFRIAGLPPAAFDVRASAPGASPTFVAGVTLRAGGSFPLRLALAGTGAVEGTVSDLSGRPLAGVPVRVVERGDGLSGAAALEARTGFDGGFRLEGLELGRALLVARQDGVALGASRAVRVQEGRASRADFFLAEPGFLAGHVRMGGEPPRTGAVVVAVAMKAGLGTLQVARASADATGNYSLALPSGEYRVHAAPAAAARTDLRVKPAFARVAPGSTTRVDLEAARAAPDEGVEILVLEPGGAPSPGAVVTLGRPGDDGTIAFATSAGEDGRVALGRDMGVAGRRVVVRARNGGRSCERTLELPASGTVSVTLSPGGALEGVVRGRGAAVRGFTLEVASQPAAAGWRTVDVHRFAGDRFELGDLPSEPLRLVVRADDGRRGEALVRVPSGEERVVDIALGPR